MPTVNPTDIKIAYFHLAFLYSGGGEKLALKEISLLRKLGYSVDCYTPLLDTTICFPDVIKKAGAKEIIPGVTKLFHRKPEIGVLFVCLLFPFLAFKFRKYDIVIGANQPGPIFGFILKSLFKIPYLIYIAQPTRILYKRPIDNEVGIQIKGKMQILPHIVNILRPLFYWVDLKSILSADIFLTNGIYMQEVLSQIYGKKPIVCSPGASINNVTKRKDTTRGRFQFRTMSIEKPFIFMSNRHFPHKKFEYALEILDSMENKIPLVISGEPTEYTDELRKLVTYFRLEKYVYFLGYVTEKELKRLYRESMLYLYTSPEEDFGMGIIEAMAHGKPVIAWNNAGPSKIITHQHNGFLASPGENNDMRKYIQLCLENSETTKMISKNAAKTIEEKYTWSNHQMLLHTHIQKIMESRAIKVQRSTIAVSYDKTAN